MPASQRPLTTPIATQFQTGNSLIILSENKTSIKPKVCCLQVQLLEIRSALELGETLKQHTYLLWPRASNPSLYTVWAHSSQSQGHKRYTWSCQRNLRSAKRQCLELPMQRPAVYNPLVGILGWMVINIYTVDMKWALLYNPLQSGHHLLTG